MQKIVFDKNGGGRCGKCRRLLFKSVGGVRPVGVEIKCHSCKEINVSEYRFCSTCRWYQYGCCMNVDGEYMTQEKSETDSCKCWDGGVVYDRNR